MNKKEEEQRIAKLVADFRRLHAMNEDDCELLRNKISWFAFEIRQDEKKKQWAK